MIQVRRRRKLWLRSGLDLQFDGNAMLNARKLYRNFSLRPQQGLGLSAAVPPVIPVPWLSAAARLALSRSGFSGHQWQKSLSSFRESVLSLSCATLLVMYSPMCHTLCLTLCCQTIFHNPAALALCVWLYHPAKESPFSSLYLGRCVCVTKQRRPLSLDPRSFCFP